MIGADKYSKLSVILRDGKKDFQEYLVEKYQYNSDDVGRVENIICNSQKEISDSEPEMMKLENEKKESEQIILTLEKEKEKDMQKEIQLQQVKSKKEEFISHVKKEIKQAQSKQQEVEKVHDACQGCFPIAKQKRNFGR